MRDQDVLIARAMGLEIETQHYTAFCHGCEGKTHIAEFTQILRPDGEYDPVPDYGSREGSWSILDYVRENSDSKFAQVFEERIDFLLDPHRYHEHHFMLNTVFARMTPSIIKQAAYEAAKECME